MGAGVRAASAQGAALPFDRRFRLTRRGSSFGTHSVVFRRDGSRTIVAVEIAMLVRIAFINAFRYRHNSEEVFEGGRLIAMRSTTNDNGLVYGVTGQAAREAFRMEGVGGPFIVPAAMMTTNSIWDPDFVRQRRLIDVQHGGQVGLVAGLIGTESIQVRGTPVQTRRYRVVMPYCAGHIWYSLDGHWVHGVLEMRGETIEYVLE